MFKKRWQGGKTISIFQPFHSCFHLYTETDYHESPFLPPFLAPFPPSHGTRVAVPQQRIITALKQQQPS